MQITMFAKCRTSGKVYTVELRYKLEGKFILRPAGWMIANHFQQFITQSTEQVKKNFRLFPVFKLGV